jgi:hypothetical protein
LKEQADENRRLMQKALEHSGINEALKPRDEVRVETEFDPRNIKNYTVKG